MSALSFFRFISRPTEPAESVAVPTQSPSPSGPPVEWYSAEYEGQLAVDVYQTKSAVVVKSTIAGVKPEDLEVTLNNDVITLRGRRQPEEEVLPEDYLYRECYWGGFSRSIVLPVEVRADKVQASLKNGILTVILPKAAKISKSVAVKVAAVE
ncbi:MAG: Hsp20/alpha crystallin family protein [Candidatus Kerfeldbacteria bacterium]|nr:Hsp20/alpha crystallin family protein [Candidatus Kerfeldbacteria bacterium]